MAPAGAFGGDMNRKDKAMHKSSGFVDTDLKTDEHDRIMLWLHKNIDSVLSNYGLKKDSVVWELPITKGSNQYKSIIGYIDLAVKVNREAEEGLWIEDFVYFEVKSYIKNVGELIRQIRQYKTFCRPGFKFFAVSPDDRFIDILEDQGIGFIKAPEKERYISPEMESLLRGS